MELIPEVTISAQFRGQVGVSGQALPVHPAQSWAGERSHLPSPRRAKCSLPALAVSAKNKKSSANRARHEATRAALKDTLFVCTRTFSCLKSSIPTPLQLQQQLRVIHPAKSEATESVQAGGHSQWPFHELSPRSALRGAEQSCFTLDICHATRASPLPIRPPTHLHPSPVQTLPAVNKQWKCQPVPGESPRQLHPTRQAWEQLPWAALVQGNTQLEQSMARHSTSPLCSSGRIWLVSPGCFQHHPSTKSLGVPTTHYTDTIQPCSKGLSQLPNFPAPGFCRKAPA